MIMYLQATGSFSGTYVMASERVAVYTGGKTMSVVSGGIAGHMFEQTIPVGRHGKEYVVPSLPQTTSGTNSPIYWTAVTISASTQLTANDFKAVDPVFLSEGDVVQQKTGANTPVKITGTNPFYMVSFQCSNGYRQYFRK